MEFQNLLDEHRQLPPGHRCDNTLCPYNTFGYHFPGHLWLVLDACISTMVSKLCKFVSS